MLDIDLADDMAVVAQLFREYAKGLGVDLSFQGFDAELASLPADYDPILIARWGQALAGCVALRAIDSRTCEMKRLYVRADVRGMGVGRALAIRVIDEGRRRGFARMRLDTLPTMTSAIRMYEALGFVDIPPYRFNPIEGARYLEAQL